MKPVQDIFKKYSVNAEWVDPFMGSGSPAGVTNDIDPKKGAKHSLDALEFMEMLPDKTFNGVLLDPPYSHHQATMTYKNKRLIKLTPIYKNVKRVLKDNGLVIHFGWNSNGIGFKNGFEIIEVLVIPHGGHHNDTIITVERCLN